jgi:hypothetical protein
MRIFVALLLTLLPTTLFAKPDVHKSITKAYQGTCAIQSNNNTRGTGVLLANGYVVTAAHVIDLNGNGKLEDKERIVDLKFYTPKPYKITGWVILLGDPTSKRRVDIALIIPDKAIHSRVKMAKAPGIGTPVFTVGHPLGGSPTITDGRVSHPNNQGGRSSIPVYSGNSGGGVFLHGSQNLIGIIVRVTMDTRPRRRAFIFHLSEYVPIRHVKAAINHLDKSGISPFELLRFMKSIADKQAKLDKASVKKAKKSAKKAKKKKRGKKKGKPAKKAKPKAKKYY